MARLAARLVADRRVSDDARRAALEVMLDLNQGEQDPDTLIDRIRRTEPALADQLEADYTQWIHDADD